MKKFISFVMAAVLCVGMTTTVFAANSVDTDAAGGTEGMIESVGTVSGEDLDVKVNPLDAEVSVELSGIGTNSYTTEAVKAAAASLNVESAQSLGFFDVKVLDGNGQEKAAQVKFYINGITANSNVVVLHYVNGAWKNVTGEKGDGYVVGEFDSYSPVMIASYTVKATTPPPVEDDPDPAPAPEVAPKTADVAMFGLYAAVALAGTVTAARKAKASK